MTIRRITREVVSCLAQSSTYPHRLATQPAKEMPDDEYSNQKQHRCRVRLLLKIRSYKLSRRPDESEYRQLKGLEYAPRSYWPKRHKTCSFRRWQSLIDDLSGNIPDFSHTVQDSECGQKFSSREGRSRQSEFCPSIVGTRFNDVSVTA